MVAFPEPITAEPTYPFSSAIWTGLRTTPACPWTRETDTVRQRLLALSPPRQAEYDNSKGIPTWKGDMMPQPVPCPDGSGENGERVCDGIKGESHSPARKTSFGYVPFANLDLSTLTRDMRRTRSGPQPSKASQAITPRDSASVR